MLAYVHTRLHQFMRSQNPYTLNRMIVWLCFQLRCNGAGAMTPHRVFANLNTTVASLAKLCELADYFTAARDGTHLP